MTEPTFVERFYSADSIAEKSYPNTGCSLPESNDEIDLEGFKSLIDLSVQQDDGEVKIFRCKSWTYGEKCALLHRLINYMSLEFQKPTSNGCHILEAKAPHQKVPDDSNGVGSGNDSQQCSDSASTSSSSHTTPETEDDSPVIINRHKRPRHRKSEISESTRGSRSRSVVGSVHVDNMTEILIGDEDAVLKVFAQIFSGIMQHACKKLAKWWIKAINPNKQTNHPYAGKCATKPWWWPETPPALPSGQIQKGNGENKLVRHMEPDHLSKDERLTLLPFILNKVSDPSNSERLNSVNIAKLEQITNDSINNETSGKELHGSWRLFLRELFRIAKEQERYKNGEIDETTRIYVHRSYAHLQVKGMKDELDEDPKLGGGCEDDVGHDRKPIISLGSALAPGKQSQQNFHLQSHLRLQQFESNVNQGSSDYVGHHRHVHHQQIAASQRSYPHEGNARKQMPNQAACTTLMPRIYHQHSPIAPEPIRRHSDTSEYFSSPGPGLSHYLSNATLCHPSTLQYQTIPPGYQLQSTPNSSIGPFQSLQTSTTMARPAIDVIHPHSFHNGSLFDRTHATFLPLGREILSGRHGNLQQLSQQPLSFRSDFAIPDNVTDMKQESPHASRTFNFDNMDHDSLNDSREHGR